MELVEQASPHEQRQKPLMNRFNKLVNSNLPAEAKTAVVEAYGSK